MRRRQVLVVDWQVEELANAVEASSVLFRCLETNQLASEEQVVAAERAALSTLDLTISHMRQLVRALRFQVDAADLFTAANSTQPSAQLRGHHAVLLLPGGKARAERQRQERVSRAAKRSSRIPASKNRSA